MRSSNILFDSLNNFCIPALIKDCANQTLTVEGLPFWFNFSPGKWKLAGTDIEIIDYIGTDEVGLLYLNKPILVEKGKIINLTYK